MNNNPRDKQIPPKKKIVNLYSITDWDYHRRKVSWDDFFDGKGKFLLTVATMEMAKEDGYLPDYVGKSKEPFPKRIFIQEKDKSWTIFEDVKYFTPKRVQELLNDFGRLTGRNFIFKYKIVPRWWKAQLTEIEKEIGKDKELKKFLRLRKLRLS